MMKKENNVKVACCSPRQKVLGIIALGGLFVCGLFVGATINGKEKTGALNVTDVTESRDAASSVSACAGIENFLLRRLKPFDSDIIEFHSENIDIYKTLIESGCPENVEKYQGFLQQETAIVEILKNNQMPEDSQTCAEIEALLTQMLPVSGLESSDTRIERAKIYANLSERGCPENSEQYVNLAAKELEIARALRDDKFSQPETVEVVETYKRLEMKQAANEVLNKVQKLTDPAIDFIIQVQKIIEE